MIIRHVKFDGRFRCKSPHQAEWGWVDVNDVEWDDEYDKVPREPILNWTNRTADEVLKEICENECESQCETCECKKHEVIRIIERTEEGEPDITLEDMLKIDNIKQLMRTAVTREQKNKYQKMIDEIMKKYEE